MTPRRVSLREVARLAGVSPGTASRVLSGSDYPVSETTRAKVREAAETLGYVTDFAARALVTGRSALVGAIVHDITDPYFSGVVRGLQDEAVAAGLVVLVGNDDRDAEKLEGYLTMMLSQKPAGVVLVGGQVRDPAKSLRMFRAVERLRAEAVPVAAVGRYEFDIPHAAVDDAAAAECAVKHLIGLGHTQIAFVAGPLRSTTVEDRLRGYQRALNRAGVPVDDALVVQTPLSITGGSLAADELTARGDLFTAVFAATDEVAFGVISGLRNHGLSVPEDVSVVGMDDVPMAAHTDPPLTTIHMPTRELGRSAWHLLAAIREGGETPRDQFVPFDLVIRASTAPPGAGQRHDSAAPGRPAATAGKER